MARLDLPRSTLTTALTTKGGVDVTKHMRLSPALALAVVRYDELADKGPRIGAATDKPRGLDFGVRASCEEILLRVAKDGVIDRVPLRMEDGGTKTIRIVWHGGLRKIHPDDLPWVLDRIDTYLLAKPIWATPSRRYWDAANKRWVDVSPDVAMVATRYICPERIPEVEGVYTAPAVHDDERRKRNGYDDRLMKPWGIGPSAKDARCIGGNATGQLSGRVVCLPCVDGDPPKIVSSLTQAQAYNERFWRAVNVAIQLTNEATPDKKVAQAQPPKVTVQPPTPTRGSFLPLFFFASAVGIVSIALIRTKR